MDAIEWVFMLSAAGWTALLAGLMLSSMERPHRGGPQFRIWPVRPSKRPAIPSAAETRANIDRFQKARERWELIDFIWDRFAQGRGLISDHPKASRHRLLNEIFSLYLPPKTARRLSR